MSASPAVRVLEPIPAVFWGRRGFTLDEPPVNRSLQKDKQPSALALTPTANLEFPIWLALMSSDCGRKPEFRNSTAVFAHPSVDPCFFLYHLTFNPDLPPKLLWRHNRGTQAPPPIFTSETRLSYLCAPYLCSPKAADPVRLIHFKWLWQILSSCRLQHFLTNYLHTHSHTHTPAHSLPPGHRWVLWHQCREVSQEVLQAACAGVVTDYFYLPLCQKRWKIIWA